jgi:hypothetical protein
MSWQVYRHPGRAWELDHASLRVMEDLGFTRLSVVGDHPPESSLAGKIPHSPTFFFVQQGWFVSWSGRVRGEVAVDGRER